MERELTEQELDQIRAGYPVNPVVAVEDDELDLDALDNIKAGIIILKHKLTNMFSFFLFSVLILTLFFAKIK